MSKKGRVRGIGSPFDIQWSSCSNNKPFLFDWSDKESDFDIFIDYAILDSFKYPKKNNLPKFGWLCESISIFENLYLTILYNYKKIFNHIDYIFTSDEYLLSLDHRFKFCYSCSNIPWTSKDKWKIYKKNKNTSIICSDKKMCNLHKLRQKIAEENKDKFDIYGGYLNSPKTGEKINGFYNKENALKEYMFSVVVQNNNRPHSFGELLTDCFAFGTIPIYLGNPKIGLFFDSDGIISINSEEELKSLSLNEDLYNSKYEHIKNNLEIINSMEISDDYLYKQCMKLMEV